MDIKLKNSSEKRKTLVRAACMALCAALFITSVLFAISAVYLENEFQLDVEELFSASSYEDSTALFNEFRMYNYYGLTLLYHFKNEEYIRAGGTISSSRLDSFKRELYYEKLEEARNYGYIYEDRGWDNGYEMSASTVEEAITIEDQPFEISLYSYQDYDDPKVRAAFERQYASEIDDMYRRCIQEDLVEYRRMLQQLEVEGLHYFYSDGENFITNIKEAATGSNVQSYGDSENALTMIKTENALRAQAAQNSIRSNPAYVMYENNSYTAEPEANSQQARQNERLRYQMEERYDENLVAYLGVDDDFIYGRRHAFSKAKEGLFVRGGGALGSLAATLVLFGWLVYTAGKREEDGTVRLSGSAAWYTEVLIGIVVFLIFIGGMVTIGTSNTLHYYYDDYSGYRYSYYGAPMNTLQYALVGAVGFVVALAGVHFLLALIEKAKARRLLKDSLICMGIRKCVETFSNLYHGGSLMQKIALTVGAMCLLSATIVLAPFVAVGAVFFVSRWVKEYEEVKEGVKQVKSGNLSYQISVKGKGELAELAGDINEISQGFDLAVRQELKNQRLKTELISNVSHDIKTPLTSIISYVDLLKKEGLDSEDAEKYVDILIQKSQRLKTLTEDLFEAAKASSGDIPVHFEKVDLLSLVNQGLGEMNDRLMAAGLQVILKAEEERYYVLADGQLIWRVVENLLGNVIKYAMENSRVYIDLKQERKPSERQTYAVLEIKNISKNPLNFPAEELMERFKRGDESRSTEGSGLGLAIARDLTNMQNGTFDVIVDGDLFKVVITLESYDEIFVQEESFGQSETVDQGETTRLKRTWNRQKEGDLN